MTNYRDWNFAYLVPHIEFQDPIENAFLALVPSSDERFTDLVAAHAAVRVLAENITDQFGGNVRPSAILIRRDAPERIDFNAVLGFRNAVALSSLVDGWSLRINGGEAAYPLWSDYFDLYPFTTTTDGSRLMAKSMALTSINSLESFCGQIAPHLPNNKILSCGYDKSMLKFLLTEWKKHFVNKRTTRRRSVLFRSLEVASQAARMPAVGTRNPTIHDVGISLGLWVSAFEILTHPESRDVKKSDVLDCIGKVEWFDSELKAKRYSLKRNDNNSKKKMMNFVQHLSLELYRVRNDFLHGNQVTVKSLFPFKKRNLPLLSTCAVLLYRAAIAGFEHEQLLGQQREQVAACEKYLSDSNVRNYQKAMLKVLQQFRRE